MTGMDGSKPTEMIVDEVAWGRALDPTLPPGVIALRDANGQWWRYPLAEFPADDAQVWTAP